jgi:hypothetical protein
MEDGGVVNEAVDGGEREQDATSVLYEGKPDRRA